MPTPLTKLGTLRPLAHGWEALIRVDDRGKRRGFALTGVPAGDEAAARERCNAMALLALRLRRAGRDDVVVDIMKRAARVRAGKPWDAVALAVDHLTSGAVEPVSASARVTVAEFGKSWRSGELHKLYPDHVKAKDSARDDDIARVYVDPVIGDRRVSELTLDDADAVMAELNDRHAAAFRARCDRARKVPRGPGERAPKPPAPPSPATRRHVAQYLRRLLKLSVYPGRLRESSPIPTGWLPRVKDAKAKECLYPDEDRALVGSPGVPLERRLAYGVLAREGLRAEELARLQWRDVDLVRGRVDLDTNKTDDPRSWDLDPGVWRALRVWRERFCAGAQPTDVVFGRDGVPLNLEKFADRFRRDLARAGVTREKLFERSATRQPIRVHDLRATFITTALATGRTETWVCDRTGHRSSEMVNRYRRRARTWNLGPLDPLDAAIPELALDGGAASMPADPAGISDGGSMQVPAPPRAAVGDRAEAMSTSQAGAAAPSIACSGPAATPSIACSGPAFAPGADHQRIATVAIGVNAWRTMPGFSRAPVFLGSAWVVLPTIQNPPSFGREGSSPSFGTTLETTRESAVVESAEDSPDQERVPPVHRSSEEGAATRGDGDRGSLRTVLARALEAAAGEGRLEVVDRLLRELRALDDVGAEPPAGNVVALDGRRGRKPR